MNGKRLAAAEDLRQVKPFDNPLVKTRMNDAMARLHKKNQHLLWRAGFGPSAADPQQFLHFSADKLYRHLLKAAEKKPSAFDVASPSVKMMLAPSSDNMMQSGEGKPAALRDADNRREFRKQSVADIRTLSIRWLEEMTSSPAQLREKTALFWHGHFASRTDNIIYDQQLLSIVRENALGSFRDLLFQAAHSASLTQFLNNNQNRKNHPNENFARELMELFTLGRGNYSEQDVKESARAFTGWGVDFSGTYQFHERQHDAGEKTFLGKTGNWTGDDILNIILDQPGCAVFITRKLYRYFVNESVPEERVAALARRFSKNNYDITDLLTQIFTSDWFYDEENTGNRIKSPVDWMVGMRRQLPMEWEDPQVQLLMERLLGQVLFNPPNVAGWPGGRHWIDSSSLMLRLRFPEIMDQGGAVKLKPKSDDDTEMGMKDAAVPVQKKPAAGKGPAMHSKINWDGYAKLFVHDPDEQLYDGISSYLLQAQPALSFDQLKPYLDSGSRAGLIRTLTLRLMGTPEYQLC